MQGWLLSSSYWNGNPLASFLQGLSPMEKKNKNQCTAIVTALLHPLRQNIRLHTINYILSCLILILCVTLKQRRCKMTTESLNHSLATRIYVLHTRSSPVHMGRKCKYNYCPRTLELKVTVNWLAKSWYFWYWLKYLHN